MSFVEGPSVTLRVGNEFGDSVAHMTGTPHGHPEYKLRKSLAIPLEGRAGNPENFFHSHSIVAGGLLLMSSATRLTWGTSLMIRLEARSSRS
jgi:hypothetical protein